MGRPRRECGRAKLRTWPHSAPTKVCTSAGAAVRLCGWIVPSASGCQNVASCTVESSRVDDQGLVGRGERRVGVVQRLVRAVVPAGGDRGRGDAVSQRRRRASGRGGEVRRVAERAELSRQQSEGSAQVRAEGRLPEKHPVGGVADRRIAGGNGLRRTGPGAPHRGGDVEEVARLDRLARGSRPERANRRLVPDGRDRAAVRQRRAGRETVRRGVARSRRARGRDGDRRRSGRRERCAGRSRRPTDS